MASNQPSGAGPVVALFITCLTDQFYPRVGVAVVKILEHFGCTVRFPREQTCCGQPFFNNGFTSEAAELARKFVGDFEQYQYVVTPSGSCCAMVREQFPKLLENDPAWSRGMQDVRRNTYEFVEFLVDVLKVDLTPFNLSAPETLAYHYTCHLRALGAGDESVRLLRQIGNVEFRAMEKTDQCCGFGGTFAVKYPEISGAIVEDKTNCIAATGAATLVCNDAGCSMNISGMCHRRGMKTSVRHIAEVIADAMGIDASGF
jgi:L-lactate dehydrogenase complex protein LldE